MAEPEPIEERQENEMQALKAIFGHDLRDLREINGNPWKVWRPLECAVTLKPQQGSSQQDVHVQIDLCVICSKLYPNEVPRLSLEKSKGLSERQVLQLKCELDNMAAQLVGEVMIFELAQHVQKYLHQHNKPGFQSFYEEMLCRQQLQKLQQQKVMKKEEDKKRLAIQEEIERRKEILREEERLCKSYARSSQEQDVGDERASPTEITRGFRRRSHNLSESSSGSVCERDHRGPLIIEFHTKSERQIRRGKCLGHSSRGCVVYSAMDNKTGQLYVLTQWNLKIVQKLPQQQLHRKKVTFVECPEGGDVNSYMKQISSIEQELNYLQKLHHSNLVHYIGLKYIQDKDYLLVYLLQEFVFGANLTFYLTEKLPVDTDMLRHVTTGVLEALAFLHQNNIVHKDLRGSCVFLTQTGLVRVSDYSLDKRLLDAYQTSVQTKPECIYPPSLGRGGKKADVHRLGILLLSLINGHIVTDSTPVIPKGLPPVLKDFLFKCLVDDEHQRWSAGQLLHHQFLKMKVGSSLIMDQSHAQEKNVSEFDKNGDEESTIDIGIQCRPNGHSRIYQEFEIMKLLGKGSFGNVYKVRNKLDGGIYAIKRIELDPKNRQLNRKITREVKLLSRLNHENVVRYFNSWIESATIELPTTTDQIDGSSKLPDAERKEVKPVTVNFLDGITKLAPPGQDVAVEWSVSESSALPETDSSDDSSDEEDWVSFVPQTDSSSDIVFEDESSNKTAELSTEVLSPSEEEKKRSSSTENNPLQDAKEFQFMYIQMEFCEKSTLRIAIDNGLYADVERMWRLFREIVEGLTHIHQQGMIHRDLKPVNIFLDSKDHVKIGDFGLATFNVLPRLGNISSKDCAPSVTVTKYMDSQSFGNDGDLSLTGQVGTALYVAPELTCTTGRSVYSQKVDIYSLGIIFFEMCSSPWETAMERVKVLANLRSKDIILPEDFDDKQKVDIILWLLKHDPSQRPTSLELLQSDYVPPPQVEEASLQEMVRHTLSEPQSKTYKYLIAACFKQETDSAADITYEMNLARNVSVPLTRSLMLQNFAKETAVQVFQRHGAICLPTSLLMPKNQMYNCPESSVNLMTHSGAIVTLPHDLRVAFARHVAHNSITSLKRYAIDRVYREKKLFGFHPRELYEGAFDIVSSQSGSLLHEAELLSIVWEYLCEFKSLRDVSFIIRLNHTSLVKAIFLYLGIEESKHNEIYPVLSQARVEKYSKGQKKEARVTPLLKLGLAEKTVESLYSYMESETPITKISDAFRFLYKRKGPVSSLAKQALDDLDKIAFYAGELGVKCPMVITPGTLYNIHLYSGMMCQFVCELKKKRRKVGIDVIAAGGRYDSLVAMFRQRLEEAGMLVKDVKQTASGISIALDKIILALQEESLPVTLDAVVCSLGNNPMLKEKATLVRDLWSSGIRTLLMDGVQDAEELQNYCIQNNVKYMVMLKSSETGTVKLRFLEKDRFQERKLAPGEVVDALLKINRYETSELVRSDSKTSNEVGSGVPSINISFVFSERDKLTATAKRRVENQVMSHIMPVLDQLASKAHVEVLVLSVELSVIKTLVSTLDLDSEQEFQKSITLVFERHAHHKKYIKKVCDEIREMRLKFKNPIFLFYSSLDNSFKVLM